MWLNSSIIHDNVCSLIYKKCHPKSYYGGIKYYVTSNIVFSVAFMHVQCFIYQAMTRWIIFEDRPYALLLIYLTVSFCYAAPCTRIAKTKSNRSQGPKATLLNVLHFCLISRYHQWEGWCLRLETSNFKPCHVLC
jgi:hypothetical protein